MKILEISFNNFTVLPNDFLSHFPKLQVLNASHNTIQFTVQLFVWSPILRNPNLEVLDLSNNNITFIGSQLFEGVPILKKVYLDNNFITVMGNRYFLDTPLLSTLTISNNSLKSVFFTIISPLKLLNLAGNFFSFDNSTKVFEAISELHSLRIGHPNLHYYPPTFFGLKSLSYLALVDFSQPVLTAYILEHFLELRVLKLVRGKMTRINLCLLNLLSHIIIEDSPDLTSLTISICTNSYRGVINLVNVGGLKTVILYKLGLSPFNNISFNVVGPNNIKLLNLSENNLKQILKNDFSAFSQLESLDLYNNRISYLHPYSFSSLEFLKSVNLSKNLLQTIPNGFLFSSSILELKLDYNLIKYFFRDWNKNLKKLQVVDLSYNMLSTITVSKGNVRYLLEGNKWNCDCQFYKNIITIKLENLCQNYTSESCLKCSSPPRYSGISLYDLSKDCVSTGWLVVVLCSLSALVMLIVIGFFVFLKYRNILKFYQSRTNGVDRKLSG